MAMASAVADGPIHPFPRATINLDALESSKIAQAAAKLMGSLGG